MFAVADFEGSVASELGDCMMALRAGENSRMHDVVTRLSYINSSGASSHAGVSYLDALLAAPARAPAASSVASRTAPTSAVVGLCMHDDGTSNAWCSQFRWYWWPLACAEVHQLLPGQFVVGTRVRLRLPRAGGVPKVGFPVRPKICVLSQRWRQG